MFRDSEAFSGYSVDSIENVASFYADTLGLDVATDDMNILHLQLAGGGEVIMYPKGEGHEPASFTVLNFPVDDIDAAVDALVAKGVAMEQYGTDDLPQDQKGIMRGLDSGDGPNIAWFKDPAGNILSVLQGE